MPKLYRITTVLLLLFFSGCCYLFYDSGLQDTTLIAYCISGLALSFTLSRCHPKLSHHSMWLYIPMLLLYGPYGILATLTFAFIEAFNKREIHLDEEIDLDEIPIPPTTRTSDSQEEDLKKELKIRSYYDILHTGHTPLKKALINRFLSRKKLTDIPLLKLALQDEDYEVRTFASTTLGKIEKAVNEDITSLKEQLEEKRNDHTAIKLLYKYYLYIQSGLLTPELIAYYMVQSHELVETLSKSQLSKLNETKLKSIMLLLNPFYAEESHRKKTCTDILDIYPENKKALNQLCAILFKNGQLAELKQIAKDNLELFDREDHQTPVTLWGQS